MKLNQYLIWLLLFLPRLSSAQHLVMGTITDEQGEPLPGASVWVLENQRGTTSDADGFYLIRNLDKGAKTLEVSYLGFEKVQQSAYIDGSTYQDFQLKATDYQIAQVEIVGRWADQNTPITFTNIQGESLEKANLGQDVPFLLQWTPSAVVTSDAGTGIGYTGIRIRGTDATRINVTINGVPLNDAESQGVFWVDLPDFSSSTENLQIQRGVGTSTNGTGAFGATLRLNTARVHEQPYLRLSNSLGSYNSWKHSIQAGSGLLAKRFTFDGRLSRITSDGYIDRAAARLHSWFMSGAYIGKRNSLRATIFSGHEVTYQAWWGVAAQYVDVDSLRTFNAAGMERADAPHDNEVDDYKQTHYQLTYKQQLSNKWSLDVTSHYTFGRGFFEQYKAGQDLIDYSLGSGNSDLIRRRWLDNDFYGTSLLLNFSPANERSELVFGAAGYVYSGLHFGQVIWTAEGGNFDTPHRYYFNDARKLDTNLFGKFQHQVTDKLHAFADLQYRRVDYSFEGPKASGQREEQQVDHHFFNPKAGLSYQLTGKARLYASFAVANREPNRDDYIDSSPLSRPGAERLYNAELGLRKALNKGSLGINGYYMRYDDQLVLSGRINDVGEATRINVPNSYRLGLELDAHLKWSESWGLAANLALSRNKIQHFKEYIDHWDTGAQVAADHSDTDLSFSPSIVSGAELSWYPLSAKDQASTHSLEVSLLGKYVSRQFIDNTQSEHTQLDAYVFSDLRLRYAFRCARLKQLTATLLVRNILDAQYATNAWAYRFRYSGGDPRDDPYTRLEQGSTYNQTGYFPQAGRNFLLGLSLEF